MAFQKYTILVARPDAKADHYMSPAVAFSFLREATRKATPDEMARLDTVEYKQQVAATKEVFRLIGGFYAAANMPPQSDPLYTQKFREWFGLAYPIDRQDPRWRAINGIGYSRAGAWFIPYRDAELQQYGHMHAATTPTMVKRYVAAYERLSGQPMQEWSDPGFGSAQEGQIHVDITFPLRLELDQLGNVLVQCVDTDSYNNQCPSFSDHSSCRDMSTPDFKPCSTYDWNSIQGELYPLRWYFEFAIDLVAALASRVDPVAPGPTGATAYLTPVLAMISQSFRYAFAQNVMTAQKANLSIPELARMYAALPADLATAGTATAVQTSAMIGTGFAIAAAALAATGAGAIAGAVVGLIGAIAALVTRYLPYAVASYEDSWGRPIPIFLTTQMTADSVYGAPTHAEPTLSGLRTPARVASTFAGVHTRPSSTLGGALGPQSVRSGTLGGGGGGTLLLLGAVVGLGWMLLGKRRR